MDSEGKQLVALNTQAICFIRSIVLPSKESAMDRMNQNDLYKQSSSALR